MMPQWMALQTRRGANGIVRSGSLPQMKTMLELLLTIGKYLDSSMNIYELLFMLVDLSSLSRQSHRDGVWVCGLHANQFILT